MIEILIHGRSGQFDRLRSKGSTRRWSPWPPRSPGVCRTLISLVLFPVSFWGPQGLRAQFVDLKVEATAIAGDEVSKQAIGLPLAIQVADDFKVTWCADGSNDPFCFPVCYRTAASQLEVFGSEGLIVAYLSLSASHGGSGRCFFGGPDVAGGKVRVRATTEEPVYRTVASDLLAPYRRGGTFVESELPRMPPGAMDDEFVGPGPIEGSPDGSLPSSGLNQIVVWSVGAPAGSAATPFGPLSSDGALQRFREPTPGDAAKEGGLRFQAPRIDSAISLGFDLAGAGQNPFTAYRFPEVPTGADNRFTLRLGSTEIAGLAGETVDLTQYVPSGVSALSLRGDLSSFLATAAPPLTFGLAFAQPGIARFTLTPVPEPAGICLALAGALLLAVARRRAKHHGAVGVPPGFKGEPAAVVFQPWPDPAAGAKSEGPYEFALAPADFPAGLNTGVFVGFHGNSGGPINDENPLVYADLQTGKYFHFVSNDQANVGHLDGLKATRDSLFVADISVTGSLGTGVGQGVIYQIKSLVAGLPGDVDGNLQVDLSVFGILKANFGTTAGRRQGGLTRDGQIDLSDFGLLKENFGKAAAAQAPEPSGLVLAGSALVWLWSCEAASSHHGLEASGSFAASAPW